MGVILSKDTIAIDDYPWMKPAPVADSGRSDIRVFISEREREVAARVCVTEIQIVCGDCSGEESLPRKTFLTADSRCDNCGGRSYALAARMLARELGRQSV